MKVKCNMCGNTYTESFKSVIHARLYNIIPSMSRKRLGKLYPLCPFCWDMLFKAFNENWD